GDGFFDDLLTRRAVQPPELAVFGQPLLERPRSDPGFRGRRLDRRLAEQAGNRQFPEVLFVAVSGHNRTRLHQVALFGLKSPSIEGYEIMCPWSAAIPSAAGGRSWRKSALDCTLRKYLPGSKREFR